MRLDTQTTTSDGRSRWPDAVAYREAIQTPGIALGDPLLSDAQVHLNRQGLPLSYSGRFAIVFRLTDKGRGEWALRCFTTPEDRSLVGRSVRYALLAQHIDKLSDLFVPYRFVGRGIRVAGQWYPTLAMRWAEGTTLGRWVEKNRAEPEKLQTLARTLGALLTRLEEAGIAHGDWQHDNLLVSDDGGKVTLVDYDGMFVPEMNGYPSPELGHPNYQHPARTERHFGVGLDRFACLSIQTALLAVARHPALWEKYGGDESLLFTRDDFRAPGSSPVFAALRAQVELDQDEALADSLARLIDACHSGPESTLLPVISEEPPQPLPGVAPDAASALIRETRDFWARHEADPSATTGRWWTDEVNTVVASPVVDAPRFLLQLDDHVQRFREQSRLVAIRAALVATLALLALGRNPMFLLPFAVFLIGGYFCWPRRDLAGRLDLEIARMRQLIAERAARIQTHDRVASPQARRAAQLTLADYVADKLRQTPINRLLTATDINALTTRQLRELQIETALDLSRRSQLPQVPPHQVQALQAWCREREAEAADEYRRLVAAARGASVDVQRLQMEIVEFEREIARLEDEKRRFPATDPLSYVRRLFTP